MKSCLISSLLLALCLSSVYSFVPHQQNGAFKGTKVAAIMTDMPPVEVSPMSTVSVSSNGMSTVTSPTQIGVANWLEDANTMSVSLSERKAPTAEEIAEKKKNFNLWFWGGGFVAPFLATFYYFGFKFWRY